MSVAVLNQQQHTRFQRIASTFNPGNAGAVYHKQPLIRAAMTIPRTALRLSRLDDHFCRLAATISQGDPESFAEPKRFALHRGSQPRSPTRFVFGSFRHFGALLSEGMTSRRAQVGDGSLGLRC